MKRLIGSVAALGLVALLTVEAALAAPVIGNAAFSRVWDRQDRAVAEQVTGRSWTWGPAPISDLIREDYAEAPEGKRSVQYFDKSRMEINNPAGDPSSVWYVTNGLLPVELITGRMQLGDAKFEFRGPAQVSAMGDPESFPTYADLLPVYQPWGTAGPNPGDVGKPATGFLNLGGRITGFNDFANDPGTVLNNIGVAKVFEDFMNQQGLVSENGRYVNGKVYDPLFVFGYPVTGAYWVKTKVGGKEVPVLFQVFERRVLTYNPANPPAFKVEMGNVGQHYRLWRYGQ